MMCPLDINILQNSNDLNLSLLHIFLYPRILYKLDVQKVKGEVSKIRMWGEGYKKHFKNFIKRMLNKLTHKDESGGGLLVFFI